MQRNRFNVLSLTTQSARHQFGIGVVLISVIPLLVLSYMIIGGFAENQHDLGWLKNVIAVFTLGIGTGGYLILRKYPASIARLRIYLENMVHGELQKEVHLVYGENDIAAIEKYMNLLRNQLRKKVEVIKTEQGSIEQQLHQAQKMESLGLMAGKFVHDFENLAYDMLKLSDRALQETAPRTTAYKFIEEIMLIAQMATDITKQTLSFAGGSQSGATELDLSGLVRDMKHMLRASVPKKAKLKFDLADNLPPVKGMADEIRQVVMNLVSNASDALGDTEEGITVATGMATYTEHDFNSLAADPQTRVFPIENRVPGKFVYFEVTDRGCGMDAEHLARIFNPFFTTKHGHSGLGLAVVFGTVRNHGGLLHVRSSTKQGTLLRTLFPCQP